MPDADAAVVVLGRCEGLAFEDIAVEQGLAGRQAAGGRFRAAARRLGVSSAELSAACEWVVAAEAAGRVEGRRGCDADFDDVGAGGAVSAGRLHGRPRFLALVEQRLDELADLFAAGQWSERLQREYESKVLLLVGM
jgi:hypothetical protein